MNKGNLLYSIHYIYDNGIRPSSELTNYLLDGDTTVFLNRYYYNSFLRLDSSDFLIKDSTGSFMMNQRLRYSYNGSGRLVRIVAYGPEYKKTEYTMALSYDSVGNVVKSLYTTPDGYSETSTMSYDGKVNPFYDMRNWLVDAPTMSPHNEVSITTVYGGNARPPSKRIATFTYGTDSYPVTSSVKITSWDQTTEFDQTYEYQ